MTAFNTVRFRVKLGREQEFLDAHKKVAANWAGLRHANMIKTGERTYCIIAEWSDMEALANARTQMVATLNSFRDTLEECGGGEREQGVAFQARGAGHGALLGQHGHAQDRRCGSAGRPAWPSHQVSSSRRQ